MYKASIPETLVITILCMLIFFVLAKWLFEMIIQFISGIELEMENMYGPWFQGTLPHLPTPTTRFLIHVK